MGQVKRAMVNDLETISNMVCLVRIDVENPTRVLKYLEVLEMKVRSLDQLLTLELASNPPN